MESPEYCLCPDKNYDNRCGGHGTCGFGCFVLDGEREQSYYCPFYRYKKLSYWQHQEQMRRMMG